MDDILLENLCCKIEKNSMGTQFSIIGLEKLSDRLEMPRYFTIALVPDRKKGNREFINQAYAAFIDRFRKVDSQKRYFKRVENGGNDPFKSWKRIRMKYKLSNSYDVSRYKESKL